MTDCRDCEYINEDEVFDPNTKRKTTKVECVMHNCPLPNLKKCKDFAQFKEVKPKHPIILFIWFVALVVNTILIFSSINFIVLCILEITLIIIVMFLGFFNQVGPKRKLNISDTRAENMLDRRLI